MKRIATLIAVTGLVAASGFVLADGPTRLTGGKTQTVDVKAPIRLSAAQMDKIVAGAPPTLQSPGTSDNSCNSGKCYYTNENDKVIGKPVKGFNN
jgi:hypothetical protein